MFFSDKRTMPGIDHVDRNGYLEVSNKKIQKAYSLGVNGFFVKGKSFEEIKQSLTDIVNYWQKSKVPE
jgi:hypothetical protein